MTRLEAEKILEAAFPMQGVVLQQVGSVSRVIAASGKVLGQAFDLPSALRQAIRPVLEAEQTRQQNVAYDKARELASFLRFLREKYDAEFKSWSRVPSADEIGRAEPDQQQLVPVVP